MPTFIELDTKLSILETRNKVVDLLDPYSRGGKIGLFRGAEVGNSTAKAHGANLCLAE